MILSTVEGSSDALNLVTVRPAVENALSEGTSVAGMLRYSFAKADMVLNLKYHVPF